MGNKAWGHGYRQGLGEGVTKGRVEGAVVASLIAALIGVAGLWSEARKKTTNMATEGLPPNEIDLEKEE